MKLMFFIIYLTVEILTQQPTEYLGCDALPALIMGRRSSRSK